jgi:predicted nucleotidyltransferase component of viral defense system
LRFMETVLENKNGYASGNQREVLIQLAQYPLIQENFFLTGGTALSVFYLGHRVAAKRRFMEEDKGYQLREDRLTIRPSSESKKTK